MGDGDPPPPSTCSTDPGTGTSASSAKVDRAARWDLHPAHAGAVEYPSKTDFAECERVIVDN